MKDSGFVYKWINIKNGNWYVGSHKGKISDKYTGGGIAFNHAVNKYGILNFKREIIYEGFDFRNQEEIILNKLDAAKDRLSYNLKNEAFGGTFPGELNGMYGKHHSNKTKNLIRKHSNMKTKEGKLKHSILMTGKGNPMFGKHHDEFTKEKIKNTFRRKKETWGFLKSPKHHRSIFYNIYANLKRFGKEISPRGQKTLEIENFSVVFPPYVRFCNFKSRKLNLNYIKKEFLWYLKGNMHDLSIVKHAKLWEKFISKGNIIHSNYGQYIFGKDNQFDYIIETLKGDKDSRRASIIILQPKHTIFGDLTDVPCTYGLNFRIRNDELNMTVKMRSQDSYFGLASDIPSFSFIHEMLYISLKDIYLNLKYGKYFHFVESFHIYERHFKFLKELKKSTRYALVLCPKILNKEEVDYLRKLNFNNIPEEFEFSKWLNT